MDILYPLARHVHLFPCHVVWNFMSYQWVTIVQGRCNSSALALELHLSCTNPSISNRCIIRADSMLAPNQWETSLQSNVASHWQAANLVLIIVTMQIAELKKYCSRDIIIDNCQYSLRFLNALTHWGIDKMVDISQMTFSIAFSWIEMYAFHSRFHRSLFLRIQLRIFQRWFR